MSAAWQVLSTAAAPGAWNMALDEALLETVEQGAPPLVRLYGWSPRCLSLGRNQPARGAYDERRLREHGVDVVRRLTGGRAVLHDQELTYSAALPVGLLGSPRDSYAAINRALVAGLGRLGVDARVRPRTDRRAPAPSLAPCFREPAEGEVVLGARKLIGSAQTRRGRTLLQHGSLLLFDAQHEVGALLRDPVPADPADAPATLAEALDPLPTLDALADALAAGWEEVVGPVRPLDAPPAALLRRADQLCARYRDPEWTWRR